MHVKPMLRDKALPTITRIDVVAVLDRKPEAQAANRRNAFAVMRRLFRWAISRGEAPNCHRCFGPIVRLPIATGQGREEITSLNWSELDRGEREMRLSGDRTKNGEPTSVPLNNLAIAELDRVADGTSWPRRGLVLRTSTGAAFTAHAKGKRTIDKLIADEDDGPIPPWRLHDLRRTLATGFQRLGVRFEVTEALLNHVSGSRADVAAIYQRHDWKPEKREALDAWNTS